MGSLVGRMSLVAAVFLGIAGSSVVNAAATAAPGTAKADGQCGQLVLLGTAGGPGFRANRSQPSSLLVIGGTPYLIDVGVDSMQRLAAAGFTPQDVGAVFITHHHLDHDGGLADFIAFSSIGNRKAPVTIIGPVGTEEMVRASFDYLEPSRRVFASENLVNAADPRPIYKGKNIGEPGLIYQDEKVKLFAVENTHYQDMKHDNPSYGVDKSYSYRFETPNGVVVFSGDTGPSDALTKLAQDADILVSEVVDVAGAVRAAQEHMTVPPEAQKFIASHMEREHLTPTEIGRTAAKAKVKMVVLSHYAPGLDKELSSAPYVDGIRDYYHGPVMAGRDLDVLSLPNCR